ncbi:MAG TPA: helix-hairpin-helix domain-containing protein [Bacteroidales bacterium]|nr:helix-hairpin-helix domain-containing protein [Bacteroidales bacterium]HRT33622.1 helix-hairpin-helix domain-containing protein [Bacteroidales bacterium]HRT83153.1 helix-hairpin-helix domain-containing protein [Bacteroidales bacterium]
MEERDMWRIKISKTRASGVMTLIIVVLTIQLILFLFNKQEDNSLNKSLQPEKVAESDSASYSAKHLKSYGERPKIRIPNTTAQLPAKSAKLADSSAKWKSYRDIALENMTNVRTDNLKSEKRILKSIELNSADSATLVTLPGIGPYYAKKIIQYRDKLGGFADKRQLMDIFGIDEERYSMFSDKITVDTNKIQKINLNEATYEQLSTNPYIGGYLARSIIRFRDSRSNDIINLASLVVENIIKNELYNILKFYFQ